MADSEREHPLGFQDKRRTQGQVTTVISAPANYHDVPAMRTELAASNAHGVGYYSSTKLNSMTKNDMQHALRLINDAAGL